MHTYDTPPEGLRIGALPSRRRLLCYLMVAVLIGALGLFFISVRPQGGVSLTRPGHPHDEAGSATFGDLERLNILVLGIDNNYDSRDQPFTKGARSDSMMIVSIDRRAGSLNVLSIPRDTRVQISEALGYDKINAAYALGGPQQAIRTVERFLHVPIHHYLVVRISGAKKIIDSLGGLNLDVEKTMDYDDSWGHLHVHLKKGPQLLTGEQAVGYARFRKDAESDRGRMRRQQQVIKTLVGVLKSPSIVVRFPELAKAVKTTLETDLELWQMVDLARLYRQFDPKRVRSGQISGADAMIDGVSTIVPYDLPNRALVRALLKDSADLALRDVRILLLNGSGVSGAGQNLADHLNSSSLQITRVESADRLYEHSAVTENLTNPRLHDLLAHFCVGASFKRAREVKGQEYDVIIILGKDKLLESVRSAPAQVLPPLVVEAPPVRKPPVARVVPAAPEPEVSEPEAEPTSPPPLILATPEPAPQTEPAPEATPIGE